MQVPKQPVSPIAARDILKKCAFSCQYSSNEILHFREFSLIARDILQIISRTLIAAAPVAVYRDTRVSVLNPVIIVASRIVIITWLYVIIWWWMWRIWRTVTHDICT